MSDTPGERVGVYRLEGELGRGGMGVVYRARAPDGRRVALKRLERAAADEETVARFLREACVRLSDPNVVRTLGGGVDAAGRPFLVMELLEGEPLERRMARRLDWREAAALGIQACRGLAALHAAGLVHRDVKPSNLFVCDDGTLKLLDLGIAAALDAATRITRSGDVVGTPSFLSPEQARGRRVDGRADLWALGLVLYQALSGEQPFARESALATMLAIVAEPAPSLARRRGGIPLPLARAIDRCLAKDPEARFESADALREVLEQCLLAPDDGGLDALEEAEQSERRVVALLLAVDVERPQDLSHAVEAAGGELIELLGARAAGIFGADTSRGDELRRALDAAVEARGAARGIAIACGHATLQGGLVAGDVLVEAEHAAEHADGTVVVGSSTARLLESYAELALRAPGVYEVVDRRSVELTAPVAPLAGRTSELGALARARDLWLEERRGVGVLITGPPGSGKSRLADAAVELFQRAGAGVTVRAARADHRATPIAFSLLQRVSGAPPAPGRGAALDPRLDPVARADRARLELLDALESHLAAGPLALVLEDLQWSDDASLELVDELPLRFADAPLLVLVTGRAELLERVPDLWAGHAVVERIQPSPLRIADVTQLFAALAGRPPPRGLAAALTEHTGGNPLFVEHIVRALLEAGPLPDAPSEWPLPLTVEAAVQARLDRLPADLKDCLKRLALLERPAHADELGSLGVDEAPERLAALGRSDLVSRLATAAGQRVHRVRSPVVAEVAYRMMPESVRRALHAQAARMLAAREGTEPEEIATHHLEAGERELAGPWFAAAALAAARRGDGPTVLRCVPQALSLGTPPQWRFELHFAHAEAARFARDATLQGAALEAARAAARDDEEVALALTEHAEWLRRTGRLGEALARGAEAVERARRSGSADVQVRAACRHATALAFAGRIEPARALLASLETLEPGTSATARAILADVEGYLAGSRGDHGARREAYVRAAALYTEAGDLRRAAGAESNAADAANRVGDHADAEADLRRCLVTCRRLGNRLTEGYALTNLGHALGATGRAAEAVEVLDEAARIAAALDDPHLAAAARLYGLRARLALEDPSTVAEPLEQLGRTTEAGPAIAVAALALAARARLAAGDPLRALALADEAVRARDAAGSLEEGEAEAFLSLALALEANGRGDEAARARARGRARVEEIAAQIEDAGWRRRFLEDVEEHRALRTGSP